MSTRRPNGRQRGRVAAKKGAVAPTPPGGNSIQDNLNSGGAGVNSDIQDDLNSGGGGINSGITDP